MNVKVIVILFIRLIWISGIAGKSILIKAKSRFNVFPEFSKSDDVIFIVFRGYE